MNKGKLIVVEGLDGSGKSTQIELLMKALSEKKIFARQIKLPDYDSSSSALVKMYLSGEFGTQPGDVNAYAASSFYAVDRYAHYKIKWEEYYLNGGLVIADRYTTSNAYHQATKLPAGERDEYFEWLGDFEYNKLGVPEPDVVIYLDMPIEISQKLMSSRYNNDEGKKDIHEKNIDYLLKCREQALYAAEKLGWHVINCAENGGVRDIQDIAKEVFLKVSEEIKI